MRNANILEENRVRVGMLPLRGTLQYGRHEMNRGDIEELNKEKSFETTICKRGHTIALNNPNHDKDVIFHASYPPRNTSIHIPQSTLDDQNWT